MHETLLAELRHFARRDRIQADRGRLTAEQWTARLALKGREIAAALRLDVSAAATEITAGQVARLCRQKPGVETFALQCGDGKRQPLL